jgi:hypothetical protein
MQRIEDKGKENGSYIKSGELIWFVRETGKTFIYGVQQYFPFVSNYLFDKYMFGLQDLLTAAVEQLSSYMGRQHNLTVIELSCLRLLTWFLIHLHTFLLFSMSKLPRLFHINFSTAKFFKFIYMYMMRN